jgi:hypothetical protein
VTARYAISLIDVVSAAALIAAGLVLLTRAKHFCRSGRSLLLGILLVAAVVGAGNVLEWTGAFPEADFAEDFLMPLLPVLWLFLFLVVTERTERERLQQAYDRMSAVHDLASQLTATQAPQAILETVVGAAARLLRLPLVMILTPDRTGTRLVTRAARGMSPEDMERVTMPVSEGLAGHAFRDRRPYQTADLARDLVGAAAEVAARHGVTNVLSVPLLRQGEPSGALNCGRADGRPFSPDEVALLETFCADVAVALESARLYTQVTESESRYRVLVENAMTAIAVVDADRRITFWNRGAERLFDRPEESVLGEHIELIYPEEKRSEVSLAILPVLQREGLWSGEFPLVRRDGTRFTAFMNLSRVFDPEGNVLCTLGILTDVTERAQLREQLYQAQKMQTVGTLAGGIAHDFNNLLTAILGFTELLKSSLPKDSEDHESAVSIEQAAQRGAALVKQLMAFSHRQPARRETISLNDVVRETAEFIQRTFPRTTTLVTRLAFDLHSIQADPNQMHQVIMNLAINARDAMAKGGTLTIATSNVDLEEDDPLTDELRAGPCVVLMVSDTGCGIAPEHRSRIFEPFFTTKGDSGGTGLGLSTVYAIVSRHGGRVTFKSQVGMGTTFRIVLPATRRGFSMPGTT